ncbi:3-deoxy-7-phosphoheptulonate synthase [Burkholderiales bacterium]|nr:3-deoxy-7-phosphoheptulonate synthase [Burkholderiales bacterium]
MIIVMEPGASQPAVEAVEKRIRAAGLAVHVSRGVERTLVGAIGDERSLEPGMFESMPGVERAMHIVKPYKLVSREWHRGRTVVDIGGAAIGGDDVQVIAGPCSIESDAQMAGAAGAVARGGARLMRGGAFKPRTSPYAFQGLGVEGLRMLKRAAAGHGLPVVTELMDVRMLDTFLAEGVDAIQVGTRNMQNFDLLKEVGRVQVPVVLKRGMSATIAEWLMAAEYVAAGGNHRIVLCERGIRTFETAYRNVLDVTAIPYVKRESHLPVIVDPSHAGGKAWMVPALACAALAAGADGLLVEVHPCPSEAWCDADQALAPDEFASLMARLGAVAAAIGRAIAPAPADRAHAAPARVATG